MNRSKLLATGLLVGVFASGAVVGGAATAFADRNPETNRRARVSYIDRLDREIQLRPEQREAVSEVVKQYNLRFHELWARVRPESDQIRAETRAEIFAVLDPAQQPAYEAMNARIDSVRAEKQRKHDKRHAENSN